MRRELIVILWVMAAVIIAGVLLTREGQVYSLSLIEEGSDSASPSIETASLSMVSREQPAVTVDQLNAVPIEERRLFAIANNATPQPVSAEVVQPIAFDLTLRGTVQNGVEWRAIFEGADSGQEYVVVGVGEEYAGYAITSVTAETVIVKHLSDGESQIIPLLGVGEGQ